jgi:hypothetical protein
MVERPWGRRGRREAAREKREVRGSREGERKRKRRL